MAPSLLKVVAFLALIGPLITIHELGHFLVAKLFNIKILRFSIGFGPRLLGFTKGETEYQIALLPLGGYVKMAGDDPTERPRPEDEGRGFLEQAPWKRALVALAGPVTNLVFPILIFFCVFYFQTRAPSSRVGHVEPGTAAWAAGLRDGDLILAVDGHPVTYFDQLKDLVGPKFGQKLDLEIQRPDGTRFETRATPQKVIEPGILRDHPVGRLGVTTGEPASVVDVAANSPAAKAGLQPLDRITRVAGKPVKLFSDVRAAVAAQRGAFEVEYLRAEPLGTPGAGASTMVAHQASLTPAEGQDLAARTGLSLPYTVVDDVTPGSPAAKAGLQRGDELLTANGTPLVSWDTLKQVVNANGLKPLAIELRRGDKKLQVTVNAANVSKENELGKEQTVIFFGATHDQSLEPGELIPLHLGVLGSLSASMDKVEETTRIVVEAFVGIVVQKVAFKTVGGPVMLFDIAGKSAEAGWDSFLEVMAAISVNLGVLNLIPVPVLDGFHVLSAGFEWVRRRPISLRAREVANIIGLAMILLVMAFVLKNDLMRYVFN